MRVAGGSSLRNGPQFTTYINLWKYTILKLLDLFPRLISDTSQYVYCKHILIHITILDYILS